MLDLAALLDEAVALHRSGDARAADRYRRILAVAPTHGDALHLLGLLLLQGGDTVGALRWTGRAVRVDPGQAYYRNSLGEALRLSGDAAGAWHQFQSAVRIDPGYPDAYANLLKLGAGGSLWPRYLSLHQPTLADLRALAEGLVQQRQFERAATVWRAAVAQAPDEAALYLDLGTACLRARRPDAAVAACRRAVALAPDRAGVWNNLATALWDSQDGGQDGGQDGEGAMAQCRRAIALLPTQADAYANLSFIQRCRAQTTAEFEAAERLCQRALRIDPGHPGALNNLAVLRLDGGRLAEAEMLFRGVLAADPGHADARFNLGLTLLKAGRLREGWDLYEARWDTHLPRLVLGTQPWQGEALRGERVLLHAEQGQGDTLQFVRYAPLVARCGGRVELVVQPALRRLLAGMPGIAAVHVLGEAVPLGDRYAPLLSLPRLFGTTLETIPAAIPYLQPPADVVAAWLARPLPSRGLRVGLVWSGDARPEVLRANLIDRRRSLALADFARLADVPGVSYVSLQMGPPRAQISHAPAGLALADPMDGVADFADTAALILRLDLVITVDTAVAHLAGALGKPVWLLSRFDGCWRWLADGEGSPWYPSLRLFRQPAPGDWATPLACIAADLAHLAGPGRAI